MDLLNITDRLLGPGGCPWDQEQTFETLQKYLLEEVHELIEAIDSKDPTHISEELGDVLFSLIFIAKLGEKQKLFTLSDAVRQESEKLIRRHPHIFANLKIDSVDDIVKNWEQIKKKEKERKTILDGIPPTLPSLTRAQKIIEKLRRSQSQFAPESADMDVTEEEIGRRLWEIVADAQKADIDAEGALRRYASQIVERAKNTGD